MTEIDRPTLKKYDSEEKWRCPQLGGPVTFEYCRRMNFALPCHLLFACWGERIEVEQYLKENFSPEEMEKVFAAPPRGRVGTMLDALAQVEEQKKGDD